MKIFTYLAVFLFYCIRRDVIIRWNLLLRRNELIRILFLFNANVDFLGEIYQNFGRWFNLIRNRRRLVWLETKGSWKVRERSMQMLKIT